jgi:glutamate decarboxylase
MRGWQVPAYPLPPARQETVIQRVLIRHGIGRDEIASLAGDIGHSLDRLTADTPADRARTGFHH